jgi:sec-independent protein translocase protein TatB
MFDIGFSELVLCFLVALIVLGPEKLPGVARTLGRWTGTARGYLRKLSTELEREAHTAELKKNLLEAKQAFEQGAGGAREAAQKLAGEAQKKL